MTEPDVSVPAVMRNYHEVLRNDLAQVLTPLAAAGEVAGFATAWGGYCAAIAVQGRLRARSAVLASGRQATSAVMLRGIPETPIADVTQTQYTTAVKSAVIPQIRVEPELRAELESVLQPGETLTDFVEATVRNAIAFRRVQTSFHARAQAASEEFHRTGISVPVEPVLERLQSKLDARRKKLGR
jgi:hypothetical protein